MRAAVAEFSFLSGESGALTDDLRELFADLSASLGPEQHAYSGECHPALDVVETTDAVEIVMDVAGVPSKSLRVLFRNNILVVAGEKAPAPVAPAPTFHLIEREFGRFARAVRLSGAFEVAQAHATLGAGELRIVLPKRPDRRGRPQPIPVEPRSRRPA